MLLEVRKIHVIEEILKVDNEKVLINIESILNIAVKNVEQEKKISDFFGILTREEADVMRKAIAETCEKIDKDDWE